jgi:hypothetical protein
MSFLSRRKWKWRRCTERRTRRRREGGVQNKREMKGEGGARRKESLKQDGVEWRNNPPS